MYEREDEASTSTASDPSTSEGRKDEMNTSEDNVNENANKEEICVPKDGEEDSIQARLILKYVQEGTKIFSDGGHSRGGAWAHITKITKGLHFKVNHSIREWINYSTGKEPFGTSHHFGFKGRRSTELKGRI